MRIFLLFPLLILSFLAKAQTLTVTSVSSISFCAGSTIAVDYTVSDTLNSGNVFTVQLSNSSGSFTSPVNLGTKTSTLSGSISVYVGFGTAAGTGYRIRVTASNPALTSADNGTNITIKTGVTASITTNSPLSAGSTLTLSANTVTSSTYSWSGPNSFSSNLQNASVSNLDNTKLGTYTLRINKSNGCSDITTKKVGYTPVNDECADAIALAGADNCNTTSFSTEFASESAGYTACAGTDEDDVWYKFVATNSRMDVVVTGASGFDAVVQVFSGNCGAFTSLICEDATASGAETASLSNLTVGQTYYIRVYDYSSTQKSATVTICVQNIYPIFNPTPTATVFCPGASITVSFTKNEIFNSGNVFKLEMSDANGSFASPVQIGSITSTTATSVTGTIPVLATAGTGYLLRVVSTNLAYTSSPSSVAIQIKERPNTTVSSNSPVLLGSTINLTSTALPGATYSWTGPSSFSSTLQSPSAGAATFAKSGTYYLTLTLNGCTNTIANTVAISVPNIDTCGGHFYDINGSSLNYDNNVSYTQTLCSSDSNRLRLDFNLVDLEKGYDKLYVYDGPSVASPLKWAISGSVIGTDAPRYIVSTNTCLTFKFVSDATVNKQGWDATVSCQSAPIFWASDYCNTATTIIDTGQYYSVTSEFYTVDTVEAVCSSCSNFSGTLENNSWVSFVAHSSVAQIKLTVSACQNNDGLQVGVYKGSCGSFTLISNSLMTSTGTSTSSTLNISNLNPGEKYYIMFDGYAGDVCEFSAQFVNFYQTNPLTVSRFTPATACANSIDSITVYGSGFYVANGVKINGNVVGYRVVNDSTIYADIPSGIYSGKIEVKSSSDTAISATNFSIISKPTAGSNSPVTAGNPISLIATTYEGATYTWSGPLSYTSTTQNPNILSSTTSMSGSYYLNVNAPYNCSVTDTVDVVVNPVSSISVGSLSSGMYCQGVSLNVPFTISSTFNAGNVFTAQLSDASGSFASPVNIGSLTATTAGSISTTIPVGTAVGSGYRIRVVSSNPVVIGNDNGNNLFVSSSPSVISTAQPYNYCNGLSTNLNTNATVQSGASTAVFSSSPGVSIPDNVVTGVSSVISVSGLSPSTIQSNSIASVKINITHTYDGDLDIYLISPSGTVIDLSSDNGASGNDYINTVFSSTASTSITTGTAPFTGSYLPEVGFSSIYGQNINGNWTLKVVDDASVDVGVLNSWSITFAVNNSVLSYSWSPASGLSSNTIYNPVCSVTSSTVYTCTVTDLAGCVSSDTVNINVNALPTITGTLNACVGSTTTLTGSGTAHATTPWTSSNTGVATISSVGVVTGVAAGTSTITYMNTNGCTKTATVTINALPTITGTLSTCVGTTTTLTGSGTAHATTPWTSSNTGVATISSVGVLTGVAAGTSTITYMNTNGCTKTATVTINALPIISGTLSGCQPLLSQLTGSATANATTPWLSSNTSVATISSTGMVLGNTPGTTTITYTNNNGCSNTATVTVLAKPTATASSNSPVNNGSTINLTANTVAGATYAWSGPNSYTSTSQNSSISNATSAMSGDYFLIVTANGCINVDTVNVAVNSTSTSSLIINEISQGITTYEYVELAVVDQNLCSPSQSCLDLRGWYLDDNNGFHAAGAGMGITSGTLRFTQNSFWSCVPMGTIILIYNPNQPPSNLPSAIDTSLNDGNNRIILPIAVTVNGLCNYVNYHTSLPIYSDSLYPHSGFVTCPSNPDYSVVQMSNSGDSFHTVDSLGNIVHAVSWGNNNLNNNIYFASPQSSLTIRMENIVDDNPYNQANWTSTSFTNETPGLPNNAANSAWLTMLYINSLGNTYPLATSNSPVNSGDSIKLEAAIISGATYSWSGPNSFTSTSQNPSIANATLAMSGDYILTVSSNGCSNSDTVNVTVSGGCPSNFAISTISNDTICSGTSGALIATGGVAYTWSNGTINDTLITSTAGTFTCIVTNSSGCVDTTNAITLVVKTSPIANAGADVNTCSGVQNNLGSTSQAGTAYFWSPVTGLSSSSIANPKVQLSNFGTLDTTYQYIVTVSKNGCSDMDTVLVTVKPLPTANAGADVNACSGENATLGSAALVGYTYNWSPATYLNNATLAQPDYNRSLTNTTVTTVNYTVTATYNGCTNSDIAVVKTYPNPSLVITGSNNVCVNASYNYTVPALTNNTFTWYANSGSVTAGQGTRSATVVWANAGNHQLIIERNNTIAGCVNFDTLNVVVNSLPNPLVSGNTPVCAGTLGELYTSLFNAGNTYTWAVSGGTIATGQYSDSITVNWSATAGSRSVTVTQVDVNSCSASNTLSVQVNPVPNPSITGTTTLCQYTKNQTYNVTNAIGNTYTWSVSKGNIVSGQFTNSIKVNWDTSGSGSINLIQTNTSNCSKTVSKTITITPNTLPVISGNNTLCLNDTGDYTSASVIGDTYTWSVSGGSIVSGQYTNAIRIKWTTSGTKNVILTQKNSLACSNKDTFVVSINALPAITAANQSVCAGTNATLTASGATTYFWNTGDLTASISVIPLANTTYTVYGTDANGCVNSKTASVTLLTKPSVTVNSSIICNGSTTTLTAAGATSYTWSSGATTSSISVSPVSNASYTVIGTNASGCKDTAISNVVVNALPTVNAGMDDTICKGETAVLSASGTGATYSWTGGLTTASINVTPTTTTNYSVTTTLNGCSATDVVKVVVNAIPTPSITGSGTVCQYATNTTYSVSALIGSTYTWSVVGGTIASGQGTNSIKVNWLTSGTQTVSLLQTNSAGCSASVFKNVVVNPTPQPSISGLALLCKNDTQSYTVNLAGGDTYAWSVLNGTILNGQNTSSLSVKWPSSGSGRLIVTQSTGACSSKDTLMITVNALPVVTVNSSTICSGSNAVLNASGALNYSWSTNETTSSINVSPTVSANYTVLGSDINNCSAQAVSVVNVLSKPNVITTMDTVCIGTTAVVSASGANSYSWNNGLITATISVAPLASSSYTVIGTNASGCKDTAVASVVVNNYPIVNAGIDQSICEGTSALISGTSNVATNTWNFGSTILTEIVSPLSTTNYILEANSNNCIAKDTVKITVYLTYVTNNIQNICIGESYSINGNIYNSDGIYNDTLSSINGCDSIVVTQLTVNPIYSLNNPQVICQGDFYSFNGNNYNVAGNYNDTLTTINGCDSIVVTQLIVNPVYSVNNPQVICQGDVYTFNGNNYTVAGNYNDTLATINGCDSIVVTQLTVNTAYSVNNPQVVCQGDVYAFNGNNYNVSGNYYDTLTTINGCDSIIVTQLTVNPIYNINNPQAICLGDVYSINGNNYTTAGSYNDTLFSINGCDSIVVTQLTVNPVYSINNPQVICQGDVYTFNGNNYNVAGNYNDTLTTINGCDSIVVTQLTVNPVYIVSNPQIICQGDVYTFNGNNYNVAGNYNDTLATINGCDSIVLTQLTVNPASIVNNPQAICQGGVYVFNGNNYSIAGTYNDTLTSIGGCDSVVVTQLTVNPLPQINLTVNDANCLNIGGSVSSLISIGSAPFSYSWSNGSSASSISDLSTGNYNVSVIDANGCSNIATATVNQLAASSSILGYVKLDGNPVTTGVAKLYQKKNLQAYPLYDVVPLDNNGFFRFDNLPNDTFIVGGAPNPSSYPNTGVTYNGNGHKWELATVTVTGCSTIDTLNISSYTPVTAHGNGKITGRVIDISDTSAQRQPGEPIKGSGVTLQKRPGGNPVLRTSSDSLGQYTLDSIPDGNYDLYVDVPGCGMFNTYIIPVTVTENYFEERNFYVDSIEGFIDTVDYQIAFQPCAYIPVFNVSEYCQGDVITYNNTSIGTDSTMIYKWDFNNDGVVDLTNSGTATYTIASSGSYTAKLEVVDLTNACSKTYLRTYEVKALPVLTLDSVVTLCKGVAASIQVSGADAYTWNSTSNLNDLYSNNPAVSTNTSYGQWFYVKGELNSCYSTDSIYVEVKDAPTVNFTTSSISVCENNPVSFSNNTNGSGFDPVYVWDFNNDGIMDDTSSTTTSFIFTDEGTYSVSLTGMFNNGCEVSGIQNIEVKNNPLMVSAGIDRSLVCGGSLTINGYSNTTDVNWLWSPNQYIDNPYLANPVVSPDSTISYTVKASKDGCFALDTVEVIVIPLNVDAGMDKAMGCGNNVNLVATANGVAGTIYNWISGANLSNQTSLNVTANPTSTETYILMGVKNTCIDYDTVVVNVTPIPVNAGSDKTMMCGQTTTLSASTTGVSGVTYNWEPAVYVTAPGSANTVAKPETDTYFVLRGTKGACSALDTVFVKVDPFTVYAGQDVYINCGDTKQMVASSYYTSGTNYNWQPSSVFNLPNSLNSIAKPEYSTQAVLTVTKGSCVSRDTVMINVRNQIPISFNADKTIFANKYPPYVVKFTNTTPNTANLQFYWNFGDGTPLINAVNYTHTYNQTGNFDVSLVATSQSGGCSDTLGYYEYIVTWTPTALPSILVADGINIYPNPNQGKFVLEIGENILPVKVIIGDVVGKQVANITDKVKGSTSKVEIDLNEFNLPVGVYFIEINTSNSKIIEKLIIE